MATDLHERLTELAAHTPSASPPADLWDRGVRRRRFRQAASAALVVAVVALLGLGGWTWKSTTQPQPADSGGGIHVPDRLFQPSEWLHSFDGTPGRLVAVIPAVQHTWKHRINGFVGVTASSNEYGFLRLSHAATDANTQVVALSPDGRHLAVWVTGPVGSTPHGAQPIVGMDVYDLVTGAAQHWRLDTAHGLAPDYVVWAGNSTLVVRVGQWLHGSAGEDGAATGYAGYRWDLGSTPHTLGGEFASGAFDGVVSATGHLLLAETNSGAALAHLDAGPTTHVTGVGSHVEAMTVNSAGTRLAGMLAPGTGVGLVVGGIPAGGGRLADRRVIPLPGVAEVFWIDGWLDDQHVVGTLRRVGSDREGELASIDVDSGAVTTLMSPYVSAQVATDLLTAPRVHATAPSSPPDPRKVLGSSLALAVLSGLTLWRFRARRA